MWKNGRFSVNLLKLISIYDILKVQTIEQKENLYLTEKNVILGILGGLLKEDHMFFQEKTNKDQSEPIIISSSCGI